MDREVMQMIAFMVVVAAILLLTVCVYRTVQWGRRCAAGSESMDVQQHKRVATHALLATFFLIFSIETFSYFSTEHMTGTWLFMVHMFFAVPFLVLLLVLRFWVTGVSKKRMHKPMAYTAAFCFAGVLVTGIFMLGGMLPS